MPLGNFYFLNPHFSQFFTQAHKAENYLQSDPEVCAIVCRKALEEMVYWMFDTDRQIESVYEDEDYSLANLMHKPSFIRLIGQTLFTDINAIRKTGNLAVHNNKKKKVTQKDAYTCIINLHAFAQWLVSNYGNTIISEPFNIDKIGEKPNAVTVQLAEIPLAPANVIETEDGIQYQSPSEQLTRQLYIDVFLKEAGWDTENSNTKSEYILKHSANGLDRADYVLFGDDGAPLAVIEAKKTTIDGRDQGLQQGKRYADALEQEFGKRPIIFTTNGFEHYLWDDANYPYRQVQGFYAKEDLETLLNRRIIIKPLATQAVNMETAGRYYQVNAIQNAKETLEKGNRDILFIMATGSGKTRTAAALVEVLTKANWVKRILFLADRNPLVSQAKNSFNDYLPQLTSVNLGKEKNADQVRMVFSTYQTMINCIDKEQKDDRKLYTIGHFDLVIFDEVHRSIYQKYKAIFNYFDAIRLGLTATPKAETHRDTFELFKLETNVPTFSYELNQAVDDGFLNPPLAMKVPLKFPRQGIRYQELSEEDKLKYEETFANSSEGIPEEIESAALNKWLFNKNTVNRVLQLLMDNGLKINNGETIGKTIIFAKNQAHARFIETCFNEMYPPLKGHFLQVITHSSDQPEDKIDAFKQFNKLPQIVVSVDMLDTGIDVPEILNLVFFKEVKSSAKYWQMLGRGTRLSPHIFGPDRHKEHFYIFDYCGNFEFFGANPKGVEPGLTFSLTQRVFQLKVQLAKVLESFVEDDDLNNYRQGLLGNLHAELLALDRESFVNRPHLALLELFAERNYWNSLSDEKIRNIDRHILGLLITADADYDARRFDVISYSLMLDLLMDNKSFSKNIDTVKGITFQLLKQTSIPQVALKRELLKTIQTEVFWQNVDLHRIEETRKEIRGLLKFIEKERKEVFYTNLTDELTGDIEIVNILSDAPGTSITYYNRVASFIRKHSNYLVIAKIKNNEAISTKELEQLRQLLFNEDPDTALHLDEVLDGIDFMIFIRSIIGLDVQAAKALFAEFINHPGINATQMNFMNTLINYLSQNGTIDQAMLFERPFTDIDQNGILGLFEEDDARKIINIIDRFNQSSSTG
nr:DEAD/DEAH box helicase family protein [uncultured Pedobacter sp.]